MAAIDKIYLNSFDTFTKFKEWCEAQPLIKDKYGKENKISNYLFYNWYDSKYWKEDDCHPVMNAPYYIDAYIIRNCPIEEVQEELMVNYGHYSQKRLWEMYNEIKKCADKGEESPYWAELDDFILNDDGTISFKEEEKSDYEMIKDGELYTKPYCNKFERGKHFRITKIPAMYCGHKCNNPTPVRISKGPKYTPIWSINIKLPDHVDEGYMSWSSHSDSNFPTGTWDFCSEYVLSFDGWSSSNAHCRSIRALTRRITKWNLPVGTIIEVHGRYVGEEYEILIKK